MPRVSYSSDYLLSSPQQSIDEQNPSPIVSPRQIDRILSRKLYEQLKITSNSTTTTDVIDTELLNLIDQFFHLTYLNTIPMVNLLATAVATNFLKENIRELDKKLEEQQVVRFTSTMKRTNPLLFQSDHHITSNHLDYDDDDNLSWASAPT